MLNEKYVSYVYDPETEKSFVARTMDDLKPGDMVVVPSFSRFKMCMAQVTKPLKEMLEDPEGLINTSKQFKGEIPWVYGVFDMTKFEEALQHRNTVWNNLAQ